ncbi:hypothetical protein QQF64_021097 [Cirrhinus molitorella]|uniref:Uncharacterized protein n=1 Tax=Cirrhinus molitorella TaxID=172907 RepID=A0ABR3LEJ6_9TELE
MNTQRGKRMDDIEVGGESEKTSGLHSPDDVGLLSAMGIREGESTGWVSSGVSTGLLTDPGQNKDPD